MAALVRSIGSKALWHIRYDLEIEITETYESWSQGTIARSLDLPGIFVAG
jgi:hypothetical protein